VRGLHDRPVAPNPHRGIIPARAGFTVITDAPERGGQDHPRACGVYLSNSPTTIMSIGSSPRVRGLLVRQLLRQIELRIIPARAGFTRRRGRTPVTKRDHPRACGVYGITLLALVTCLGSSPRVRGLLVTKLPDYYEAGIIPARAGFTILSGITWGGLRDHPRACGVYRIISLERSRVEGSSPRVRGLRRARGRCRLRAGIIPARAGFTPSAPRGPRPGRDHPRACGVYTVKWVSRRPGGGSSPRVRGLRRRVIGVTRPGRIIPARAGFTGPCATVVQGVQDHPRACGVYSICSWIFSVVAGSSPRVRGLLRNINMPEPIIRIIPARAGFTHHSGDGPPRGEDHPRACGVYFWF